MSDRTGTVTDMSGELIVVVVLSVTLGAVLTAVIMRAVVRRSAPPWGVSGLPDESERVVASLAELTRRVDAVAEGQTSAQSQLSEQLRAVADGNAALQRDTSRLAEALNHTGQRGRWGEAQLRRIVEMAGLTRGVHFTEQLRVVGEDATIRPDMVITMSDDRHIVIDAKVPLDALLHANDAADSRGRPSFGDEDTAARHAAAVGAHIDQLASKSYWRQFANAPEFVVLFLPAESLLGQALSSDPALLERAFSRNVVLATPTTLLALLRTISLGWRDRDLAENAAVIHELGRELHDRLRVMTGHIAKLGSALGTAAESYNKLVGSYESRVMVSSRKMAELGVSLNTIDSPPQVDRLIRQTSGVALTTSPPP